MTTLVDRSVSMRCTLLAPQVRACVADGRSGDAARQTRVGHRGFILLLLLLLLLNRRQIDLLEAETSESRAHAFNVVSASPPPICSHI